MYIRSVFSENKAESLFACMQQNPLAMLAINGDPFPQVFHLPLLASQQKTGLLLRGHIAKSNPLLDHNGSSLICVFNGPDAYISPSFYETKKQDPKVVPTWNYVTVQVQGKLILHDSQDWKLNLLNDLTIANESQLERPWQVTDAPADYIEKMCRAIIGVEIEIVDIKGKWKVSQNQPAVNKASVIASLAAKRTDKTDSMAKIMTDQMT